MNIFKTCEIFVLSILISGGSALPFSGRGVTIVKDGKPLSVIILSSMPTRSAQLAARELQEHIRKISGAYIPVVAEGWPECAGKIPIYVGESSRTRLNGLLSTKFFPHESLIKITGDRIYLIGNDDPDFGNITYEDNGAWKGFNERAPFYRLGTLYAVYDFLETYLGVRWYMVTDLGTVLPDMKTITLRQGERKSRPWTIYRRPSKTGWQVPGELVEPGQQHKAVPARDANLFTLRSRIGGEPYSVNHSVYDYHTRFGKEHPDWFVGNSPGQNVQLKFGNPEVMKQLAEDAKQFFSHPFSERRFGTKDTQAGTISAGDFFAVGPKDNRDYGNDTVPPLQPERQGPYFGNGVASNYIWNCVNEVARITGRIYPDYYITSFAYAAMFEPPDFPLEQNVAVTACMADGWEGYGMDVLKAWRKNVSRLFTWEYYIDSPEGFPRIRPHAIAKYMSRLRDMGLDGMFIEMPSLPGMQNRNPGLYHLNYYLTFKFLREREIDADSVLKEYYRLFYGPAAGPMKVFWDTLEDAYNQSMTEGYLKAKGSSQVKQMTILASPERMNTLREAISRAERLAVKEPYSLRVKLVKDSALGRIETNLERHKKIYEAGVPVMEIPRLKVDVVLDGKLDETFWQNAAATPPFVNLYNQALDTVTVAYTAYDGKNFYVGFKCTEPFMDQQRLDQRVSTSGICTDDSVEVVIDVGKRLSDYLHVMMNANGLLWYRWPGRYRSPELFDFDPAIKGKSWRGKDAWSAELVIPITTLTKTPPVKGEEWGINFYRNRVPTMKWADPRAWSAWSPTFSSTYHVIDRFGKLKFGD